MFCLEGLAQPHLVSIKRFSVCLCAQLLQFFIFFCSFIFTCTNATAYYKNHLSEWSLSQFPESDFHEIKPFESNINISFVDFKIKSENPKLLKESRSIVFIHKLSLHCLWVWTIFLVISYWFKNMSRSTTLLTCASNDFGCKGDSLL